MTTNKTAGAGDFKTIITAFKKGKISKKTAEALLKALKKENRGQGDPEPRIAIVGIAGQFPDAPDLNVYWENLKTGHNATGELPPSYLEGGLPGEPVYPWGGVLKNRDCFDPFFFGITPREARSMNPHQRLVLQESYRALEDAGIRPSSLSGSSTGVFIGAEPTGYFFESFTGFSDAIIAARPSYFLDLAGPALVVNTGCSSSGVAIHLAWESLKTGECDLALAGGVFGLMDQASLAMMAKMGMLSPTGLCRTFDDHGDGTVISEGIGMAVLMRLEDALAGKHPVYAVIRGSGINQDGASNGLTAPSGRAQERLITDVYQRFHIDPAAITHVEAHGTGTRLGDPVEGNALVRSFKKFTDQRGYCALGSAKSHIGHTGAAAFVGSLFKVLLSMKHETLPGLIHFHTLNPLIEFTDSPFYVNTRTRPWKRQGNAPLCAAISSFGHSGTNVHMVVESPDHFMPEPIAVWESETPGQWALIPFSARTRESLDRILDRFITFLETRQTAKGTPSDTDFLHRMAFTLQAGRDALEKRVAFIVKDLSELKDKLAGMRRGEAPGTGVFTPKDREEKDRDGDGIGDPTHPTFTPFPASPEALDRLARFWVRGGSVDFETLYPDGIPGRVSLPNMAFAQTIFQRPKETESATSEPRRFIHPLVHENVSSFEGQKFSSVFTGKEFFLAGHRINGKILMPGAALLEMAARATALSMAPASQDPVIVLQNVVFASALEIYRPKVRVDIDLRPGRDGAVDFEITSGPETNPAGQALADQKTVHSRGCARLGTAATDSRADIPAMEKACQEAFISGKDFYDFISSLGIAYGPAFRGIEKMGTVKNGLVARLSLAPETFGAPGTFRLHPGITDSAIQACAGFALTRPRGEFGVMQPFLPFAVDRVEIFQKTPPALWVHVRPVDAPAPPSGPGLRKLDLDLYDDEGAPVAVFKGFSARTTEKKEPAPERGVLLAEPVFQQITASGNPADLSPGARDLVLLLNPGSLRARDLEKEMPGIMCQVLGTGEESQAQGYESMALMVFDALKGLLTASGTGKTRVWAVTFQDRQLFPGLGAMLQTASMENPNLECRLLETDGTPDAGQLAGWIRQCRDLPFCSRIRCQNGKLLAQVFREAESVPALAQGPWKSSGVYLITGGGGGLGMIFAREIAAKVPDAQIFLSGRSALTPELGSNIRELAARCRRAEYVPADISDPSQAETLLTRIRETAGPLSGVLHAAGLIRDAYIIQKSHEDFRAVLAPKVRGLEILDRATREEPLDMFLVFSSVAGVSGSPGQADYAAANGFCIEFAGARAQRVNEGTGRGKTLCISWPLWQDGGMGVDPKAQKLMAGATGLSAMETRDGLRAFETAFGLESSHVMVLAGDVARLRRNLNPQTPENENPPAQEKISLSPDELQEKTLSTVLRAAARVLNVSNEDMDPGADFRDLGIDPVLFSLMIDDLNRELGLALNHRLSGRFADLTEFSAHACLEQEDRLLKAFNAQIPGETPADPKTAPGAGQQIPKQAMKQDAARFIRRIIADGIDASQDQLALDIRFDEIGIDSIMATELTALLEKEFGSLPKTLFFEYMGLQELTGYFMEHHGPVLERCLGREKSGKAPENRPTAEALSRVPQPSEPMFRKTIAKTPDEEQDIAIIGLAGSYPQADTIHTFWDNLKKGKDCITQIPEDRWDHSLYYDADRNAPGKTYARWGGFLNHADRFDPLYFNMNPSEAVFRDPQERLFLQCVQETLEDAGYCRRDFGAGEEAGNVAVFVGVMYSEYQLYGAQEQAFGNNYPLSSSPASIANRISYFFDFNGPSMAVDSMCSSSLSAIHLACQSLARGECQYAVAGGVNLSIHPNKFLMLGQGKFASSDGRCRSFGNGGDGYVPGEGVGAVLLKPLSQAVRDRDLIYGVIRGSALNHGGRTNGYSVPNPGAQAKVISRAFQRAGISPGTVSYLETHGTGTALGDPVEITGLSKAFGENSLENGFCPIGSAKSNIGHCEAAAGIAGLTKVLLQMKHRLLVPSLHSDTPNPNIDFSKTPFRVQQTLEPWKQPVLAINGEKQVFPRIAGLSSFGAGGSNAHLIIQEYEAPEEPEQGTVLPQLFVFSARTRDRIPVMARNLRAWILEQDLKETDFQSIAYTLQQGRESLVERLGFTAASMDDLSNKLGQIAACRDIRTLGEEFVTGRADRKDPAIQAMNTDEDWQKTLDLWIQKHKFSSLLSFWVKGLSVDWSGLYSGRPPQKTRLPAYPFERERCWFTQDSFMPEPRGAGIGSLHPLLHRNLSTFYEQKFGAGFTGNEVFFRDHQVMGARVLSGAACLEMARAAVNLSLGDDGSCDSPVLLTNVAWERPVTASEQGAELRLRLVPGALESEFRFEIFSHPAGTGELLRHCAGSCLTRDLSPGLPMEPVADIRKRCQEMPFAPEDWYRALETANLSYGPSHRGVTALWKGRDEILARLRLPDGTLPAQAAYFVLPGILDSAFQAASGLAMDNSGAGSPGVPFALDRIEFIQRPGTDVYAHIRARASQTSIRKYDLELLREDGTCCLSIEGLSTRTLTAAPAPGNALEGSESQDAHSPEQLVLLAPALDPTPADPALPAPAFGRRLILLLDRSFQGLEVPGAETILPLPADAPVETGYRGALCQVLEEIQGRFRERSATSTLVQALVLGKGEKQLFAGIAGFLKTVSLENPDFTCQVIEVPGGLDQGALAAVLGENAAAAADSHVVYINGARHVAGWNPVDMPEAPTPLAIKDGATYLITGGAGGLGLIFARELLSRAPEATLILTGRSEPSPAKQAQLDVLSQAHVRYIRADISREKDVADLLAAIRRDHPPLSGIIHSAGLIRDKMILKKDPLEFDSVLAPKVAGTCLLDRATAGMALDFFVLFSSGTSAMGNAGQADYAAANAFMDRFAAFRNQQVKENRRQGHTLSINWPLWEEGGMQVDERLVRQMVLTTGAVPLKTRAGIMAFYHALDLGLDQVMVIAQDPGKAKALQATARPSRTVSRPEKNRDTAAPEGDISGYLAEKLSQIIQLPADRIETDIPFEEYGMDSISIMNFISLLEQDFGSLSKTLVFEYENIEELSRYFKQAHKGTVDGLLKPGVPEDATAPVSPPGRDIPSVSNPPEPHRFKVTPPPGERPHTPAPEKRGKDIAVIGLSGRYPGAPDVQVLWEKLVQGADCITPIPAERWDNRPYFDKNPARLGKIYTDCGGFITGVEEFDAAFFELPEREAEWTDPRERLFLETVWNLFETAGYTRKILAERTRGRVGVFVGAQRDLQYSLIAPDAVKQSVLSVLASDSYIANRVSYFFDFKGPSISVDSHGASSLTAVHLACQAILKGDCDMAVAGGVQLNLHPGKFLGLCNLNLVATNPDIRSFGDGDGFIPAEGVGAVLLKPLDAAVADRDDILAVIRKTAADHSGRTQGFTNPDPKSHLRLIRESFESAGIAPETVSFAECSAPGNAHADRIEVAALSKAFRSAPDRTGFCALGSIKANIGHAEAAAGISQLTKAVLQLMHKTIPPAIRATPLNPDIRLSASPFFLPEKAMDWKRPVLSRGRDQIEAPRRALVNAFGMGGANALAIVEEYIPEAPLPQDRAAEPESYDIAVFSAKTEGALSATLKRMRDFLTTAADTPFKDLCHTLQTCKEAFDFRFAVVARTTGELRNALERQVAPGQTDGEMGRDEHRQVFSGRVGEETGLPGQLLSGKAGEAAADVWIRERDLEHIAWYWCHGGVVSWDRMTSAPSRKLRGLPSYPFEKKRYWIARDQNPGVLPLRHNRPATYTPDPEKSLRENIHALLLEKALLLNPAASETTDMEEQDPPVGKEPETIRAWMRLIEEELFLKISEEEMDGITTLSGLTAFLCEKAAGNPKARARTIEGHGSPEPGLLPLSEGQKGLWLLQRMTPDLSAYNIPVANRFSKDLDPECLRAACAFTLDQFPVLKTVFVERQGRPFQRTVPDQAVFMEREDISKVEEKELTAFLTRKTAIPFDLEKGPLVRFHLFTGKGTACVLLIVIHHIVIDGTSLARFLATLWSAYLAFTRGRSPQLRPETTGYADFVRWEGQMMAGTAGQQHLAYWKKVLQGPLPVLSLAFDPSDASCKTEAKGRVLFHTLSPSLARTVQAFGRDQRIKPSVLFLAVFKTLLHRYTGATDIIVGMPTQGRPEPRFENVVGYFINMVVFRSRLDGKIVFLDFLKSLRTTMFEGLSHAAYPFPALVRELGTDRIGASTPVFQVAYTFQNHLQHRPNAAPQLSSEEQARDFRDLGMAPVEGMHQEGDNDLGLEVVAEENGFRLNLEYMPGKIRERTARAMMDHFMTLLEAAMADPQKRIADIPMLGEKAVSNLLVRNNPAPAPRVDLPVHRMVEAVAQKSPESTALAFAGPEQEPMSYGRLQETARAFARRLSGRIRHKGERVGVCMARCLDMVPAMLAVFRVGAVYVPIDPDFPEARIRHILEDAGIRVLLVHEPTLKRFQALESPGPELICLDDRTDDHRFAEAEGLFPCDPKDPAYMIYTSGSTGTPKGVVVSHGAFADHCQTMADYFNLTPSDRILYFASMGVDTGLEQVLPGLLAGACIVVKENRLWSADDCARQLKTHHVTVMDLPPAYLGELLQAWATSGDRDFGFRLRLVIAGGERLPVETVRLFRQSPLQKARLVNAYGPTETVITCTAHDIPSGAGPDSYGPAGIPIGRVLGDRAAYILDPDGNLVPEGVTGELYISGAIASGYHNLPGETQKRFVANRFCPEGREGHAIAYRTGDLARWRPGTQGIIAFAGRADHQVKIRGYRIEPAEIEACLNRHDGVKESLVTTRSEANGGDALVAWIIPGETRPAPESLSAFVAAQMPSWMVPRHYVFLERFPMLPGGKIDRLALPSLRAKEQAAGPGAPVLESKTGQTLARIWERVLSAAPAGPEDDFFALGGHSLLLVRLAAEISREFGQHVSMQDLMAFPGFGEQVRLLEKEPPPADHGSTRFCERLSPAKGLPAIFCVHPAGGSVLCYSRLGEKFTGTTALFGIRDGSGETRENADLNVEEMAARYVAAMREIQPQGPYLLAGWSSGGVTAYEMARQLVEAREQVEGLVLLDAFTPEAAKALESENPDALPGDTDPISDLYHAHIRAMDRYQVRPLEVPVLLIRAGQNRLPSTSGKSPWKANGWEAIPLADLTVRTVEGAHHYTLLKDAHAEEVARVVQNTIKTNQSEKRKRT